MIRVVLLGRTGNNLFQYALGRVLAEKHGVGLVLDGSGSNERVWAGVSCLGRLPLRARVTRSFPLLGRVSRRLTGRHPWEWLHGPVVCEPFGDHRFRPEYLDLPASCVLAGYFQSPRYFASVAEPLRRELDPGSLAWDAATQRLAERIGGPGSVAIHVRRTDYIGNPTVDFLGAAYYRRAIARMRELVPGCRWHVFSDGAAEWERFLGLPADELATVATGHPDPLRDLYLMSLADHQIIANSSYSWWAAWLGKHPGQCVIMPDEWYRGSVMAPIEDKRVEGWECVSAC
jgi:hypothetical protein